jgi:hypothetical protein
VLSFNEFGFNSLTLYNFRIDEQTLGEYVQSKMTFGLGDDLKVEGAFPMNRLIMAHDFKIEEVVDLQQLNTVVVEIKKGLRQEQQQLVHVGTITVEINLQSGDSEDEMRRNY